MKYKIINSGSDGNAVVINETVLIDCGVSYKKLRECRDNLMIVLLTHIHKDHFNKGTIKKLANNRPTLRFGCCEWLVNELLECGVNKSNIDVFDIDKEYDYGLFKLIAIRLYHDVSQCGYKLFMNNKKLVYATDTKTLDGITAKNYDVYLIEGNYENEEELHNRAYTLDYESRVRDTHLSREYSTKWLLENMNDKSTYEFMHQHKER